MSPSRLLLLSVFCSLTFSSSLQRQASHAYVFRVWLLSIDHGFVHLQLQAHSIGDALASLWHPFVRDGGVSVLGPVTRTCALEQEACASIFFNRCHFDAGVAVAPVCTWSTWQQWFVFLAICRQNAFANKALRQALWLF